MADNVTVTQGGGYSDTIAADEVGGAKYQRFKLAVGADGSATDVSDAAPMPVKLMAGATGGSTPYHRVCDNSTQDQLIVTGAGKLLGYCCGNINAAARFVKLYDKASAPNSGDTPFLVVPVAANGYPAIGDMPEGIAFALGLGMRACTGLANNDATAVAASEIVVHARYKQ